MTTNSTIDCVPLLPCPFCGKNARYVPADYVDHHGQPWPFAECNPCNVGAPVEFWNKRAAQPQGEPVAWRYKKSWEKSGWVTCDKHPTDYVVDDETHTIQALYAEQPAPVEVVIPDGLHKVIQDTLRNYRMGTLGDGEGGGYPLIDAMSADGESVSGGIEECEYLADAILSACLDEVTRLNTNGVVMP